MKIIKLSKVQLVLSFLSIMLLLSNYGYAAHWEDPGVSTSSFHLAGQEFTINDSDAEIGDEIAVFDSEGQLVGHHIVTTPGMYLDTPIWIDSTQTPDIDEGCSTGTDLSFCVWDESASMEYCDSDIELVIPVNCNGPYCPPDSLPLSCPPSNDFNLLNIYVNLNDPPLIPELVFPADDQTDLGDIVEFEWKETTDPDGDTVTYDLIVCTDENFTEGCVTLADIASLNKDKIYFAGSGIGLLLFGVVLAGDIRGNKRKMLLLLAMIIIIAVYSAACGSGGGGGGETSPPPIGKVTVTGTVLDKNGNAIEGAEVTISSDPQTVTTDSSGNFTAEVEVGNHEIEIMNGSKEIYSGTFSCGASSTFSLGNLKTPYGPREHGSEIVLQEVVGLTIGTTYYWKIIADDGNGGVTESEVRSFTTTS